MIIAGRESPNNPIKNQQRTGIDISTKKKYKCPISTWKDAQHD